jgi:acyl-coenzyme A thioesterase PaaI-like protein
MDQQEMLKATAENELLQFLGVKVEKAEGDHVILTMPVTPKVHQYLGIMNGASRYSWPRRPRRSALSPVRT